MQKINFFNSKSQNLERGSMKSITRNLLAQKFFCLDPYLGPKTQKNRKKNCQFLTFLPKTQFFSSFPWTRRAISCANRFFRPENGQVYSFLAARLEKKSQKKFFRKNQKWFFKKHAIFLKKISKSFFQVWRPKNHIPTRFRLRGSDWRYRQLAQSTVMSSIRLKTEFFAF